MYFFSNRSFEFNFYRPFYFLCFVISFTQAFGQNVLTNGASGLASSYSTLAQAITALNSATINSPVVITLSGNETAPAGGYEITKSGTSTNTITIQGSNSTITASSSHVAGRLNDAVFKIIGADYITLQNFTMEENSANTVTDAATNNMTEFGVALFYATTTNGAQNCTIQNNTISLNRLYQNSFGIYSNSTHSATTPTSPSTSVTSITGSNSELKIFGNNISNINIGILIIGPTGASAANTGIDVGGSNSTSGNTISNFGTTNSFSSYPNLSSTVNGIVIQNCIGFNLSNNAITSSDGGVTVGNLNGIYVQTSSNAPSSTFTNTISNNTISLQTGFATGGINGIFYPSGSASTTSILNITNNDFIRLNSSVISSGNYNAISVSSANLTTNISNNTFTNLVVNTSGDFRFIFHNISMLANGTTTINSNSIVTAFNKTEAGGLVTVSFTGASSPNSASLFQSNNNFSNITVSGNTILTGFSNSDGYGTGPSKTITGNIFSNWTGGSSQINVMSIGYWGLGSVNILSNNTITNITGSGAINGINITTNLDGTNTLTFSGNTVNGLTSSGTGGSVIGFFCNSTNATLEINVSENSIGSLSSTANTVTGMSVSGG